MRIFLHCNILFRDLYVYPVDGNIILWLCISLWLEFDKYHWGFKRVIIESIRPEYKAKDNNLQKKKTTTKLSYLEIR